MEFPKRKPLRLAEFDYSTKCAYFVTICAKDHRMILGRVSDSGEIELSPLGRCAAENLDAIPEHFPNVRVDKYVVMPNHVHALLILGCSKDDSAPELSVVMQAYKASVSRWCGYSVWQRSYFDHIIRNDPDYQEVWQYIDNNPRKWHLKQQDTMK